jgi:flagellar basal body rod protein FlgG
VEGKRQRNLMAGNTTSITNDEEDNNEEYELSPHEMRKRRRTRKRNLVLGASFLIASISFGAYFAISSSQINKALSPTTVSTDVIERQAEVATYDSEWFSNAVDIVITEDDISYFSNAESDQIFKLSNGIVTLFAGSEGNGLKDGTVENAKFASPSGLALQGNSLYVADRGNNRIRQINLDTLEVSTLAGSGDGNYTEGGFLDGASGIAKFDSPTALVVDEEGTVYITDSGNHAIRVIKNGVVSTLAGGEQGDIDGNSAEARFNNPSSIAIYKDNLLLVADTFNNKIKTVNRSTGDVSTFAGNGFLGLEDGKLEDAQFYNPSDIIVTRAGNIFIADTFNHSIRVIARNSDSIYVLAGSGAPGFKDGAMTDALFDSPVAIDEDSTGAILVIDRGNKTIRIMK